MSYTASKLLSLANNFEELSYDSLEKVAKKKKKKKLIKKRTAVVQSGYPYLGYFDPLSRGYGFGYGRGYGYGGGYHDHDHWSHEDHDMTPPVPPTDPGGDIGGDLGGDMGGGDAGGGDIGMSNNKKLVTAKNKKPSSLYNERITKVFPTDKKVPKTSKDVERGANLEKAPKVKPNKDPNIFPREFKAPAYDKNPRLDNQKETKKKKKSAYYENILAKFAAINSDEAAAAYEAAIQSFSKYSSVLLEDLDTYMARARGAMSKAMEYRETIRKTKARNPKENRFGGIKVLMQDEIGSAPGTTLKKATDDLEAASKRAWGNDIPNIRNIMAQVLSAGTDFIEATMNEAYNTEQIPNSSDGQNMSKDPNMSVNPNVSSGPNMTVDPRVQTPSAGKTNAPTKPRASTNYGTPEQMALVRTIQEFLAGVLGKDALGPTGVDGRWGPKSMEALKAWKKQNDKTGGGYLDTETLQQLAPLVPAVKTYLDSQEPSKPTPTGPPPFASEVEGKPQPRYNR